MLFHKVFLAAAAVATTYAGPCKPVSSKASVSSSADASIPSSTETVEISDATRTATSESSGTEEATSSVTIGSETVTSGGSTTLATLLSNSGSVSEGRSTSETGSRSSDVLVSTSETETLGPSTDTAVTGITTGTTDVNPTTQSTTAPTTDDTTDATATGTTTTELTGQATTDPATQSSTEPTTEPTDGPTTGTATTDSPTTLPTTDDTTGSATQPTTDTIEPTSGAITDPSTTQHSTTEGTTTEATTAAPTSTSEFCYDNAYVISMLAFDPVASPFCVSYLSMTTHTITDYATTDPTNVYQVDVATITADALTRIETNYDGITAIVTEYKTNTEWSEATVTSTRSIETITCLDTAYSYTAPVPTFDRGGPYREKRGQDEIEIPEAIPSDWTEAQTSDICSCLDLEEPTAHTTITETVEPTTFITASTDVVTPIEEYTKVITTTSVSVFTSTVTEKKTSTVTAWVVETTFADNNDIAYRRFNCPFDANIYDDGFTTNYFKGKTPLSSGNTQTLQFSTCSTLSLSGSGTFDPSQVALLYNAYFYAKETGMYTFSVPDTIDNWGYLWVKDAAYTWNVNAWAIQGTRTGQNSQLWKGGSYQIQLKQGDAIPFTYLWANGGGCAGNDLSVRTPSGESIPGMAGSTVKACHLNKFT
ncbi:uncharacterized protein FOBCDRAFT_278523 [Fusarium oxysporum Fo47]|uniref:Uncharacterized protein n=1 Tax=Fusarium oxysporum Fo47 TaxID=660027 RepID=W9JQM0_FUSOX|nr:uncharacterized protein FOBCDRAFT_278523 [Fusarium oxysporum Fo47]EWZ31643.1 hypothetical protein FOZG_14766 [Fusarium oxysporum Fo47]QKD58898.1 hypothetical protein FOBCDRAFT_278523 [Fusarium oxysporum Fo47]